MVTQCLKSVIANVVKQSSSNCHGEEVTTWPSTVLRDAYDVSLDHHANARDDGEVRRHCERSEAIQ